MGTYHLLCLYTMYIPACFGFELAMRALPGIGGFVDCLQLGSWRIVLFVALIIVWLRISGFQCVARFMGGCGFIL